MDSNYRSPGRERVIPFGDGEAGNGHGFNRMRSRGGEYLKRDQGFESISLQRRVGCEPDFGGAPGSGISSAQHPDAGAAAGKPDPRIGEQATKRFGSCAA